MRDEFTARQRAITLRLGGQPVQDICQALGRSTCWCHKWWRRYLEAGAEGRVTFSRRVSGVGTVTVLSQSLRGGKKRNGLYLRLVIDTRRGKRTAYLNGRVVKHGPDKLLND